MSGVCRVTKVESSGVGRRCYRAQADTFVRVYNDRHKSCVVEENTKKGDLVGSHTDMQVL